MTSGEDLITLQQRIDAVKMERIRKEHERTLLLDQKRQLEQQLAELGITNVQDLELKIAQLEAEIVEEKKRIDQLLTTAEMALGLATRQDRPVGA